MELLPIPKKSLQLDSLQHYELRVKAIYQEVGLKELGKILYRFNQLRGYSGGSNRDDYDDSKLDAEQEDNVSETKKSYDVTTKKVDILKVEKSDIQLKSKTENQYLFNITIELENEEVTGTTKLQNLTMGEAELEIRIKKTKKGNVSYEFALPRKTNWRKQMEATEQRLSSENLFISELSLQDLKINKWTKIRNRVILRNRYKQEFDAIWERQAQYHPLLDNCPIELLYKIANYLFPGPSKTQNKLRKAAVNGGLKYIIKEQVIYYQRPLKSQSMFISKCQFEKEEEVLPISHPLFQEFRCWDQINRMSITSKLQVYNEKKKKYVYKYVERYLSNDQKLSIYNRLQEQKQVTFGEVAKIISLKTDKTEYLNGLNAKAKLKGCETLLSIKKILGNSYNDIIKKDHDLVVKIWDILYNKPGNEYDIDSEKVSLIITILKQVIDKSTVEELSLKLAQNIKFPHKYSSLSAKAIKRILPLMQPNSLSENKEISNKLREIQYTIETGDLKEENSLAPYMIDYICNNPNIIETGGLMYAFAASLVYGTHTNNNIKRDITDYHQIQYNHNRRLRNPVVEQVINETLQILKSLWKQFNIKIENLEIRIELARSLKNSTAERERIYKSQIKNGQINERIRKRLIELQKDASPINIETYKIWSSQSIEDYPKQSKEPTQEEIEKLKIWEEQKCISPYTLQPIPLSKLFCKERYYDIDHIIPKSRYFDDSLSNKVVCETSVNEEKGNRTAWEYINQQNSKLGICQVENYINHVTDVFFGRKKKNLLLEKIPLNPILRQMKETQYISVAVKDELARIVGSNNVQFTTGEVTAFLRSKWGLRKLLMQLTENRFKRMELWDWNKEANQPNSSWVNKYFDKERNKHIYEIRNWSKRYDHRHHAIDALVVALTEQHHIQRLNNLNKELQDWLEKNKERTNLQVMEDETALEAFFNLEEKRRDEIQKQIKGFKHFEMPFVDFVDQTKTLLETMIISHKQKEKLSIQKDKENGNKTLKIRSALHESTYYGKTEGRDTKTVNLSTLTVKDIQKIVDKTTLKEEIDNHRKKKEYGSIKEAFTGEGLKAFNESRYQRKENNKLKPPVYKVKIWHKKEDGKGKLQRLYDHNAKLSVVTGDNYLFLVMEKDGKRGKERIFETVSLFDAVDIAIRSLKENDENFKQRICEDFRIKHKDNPTHVLFTLQQNDLVYLPENEDDPILKFNDIEFLQWQQNIENKKRFCKRVYKVVKFTEKDCRFIPHNYATPISIPKDLKEEEKELLRRQYADQKIPKKELNYEEFGTYGSSATTEINENFIRNLVLKKKFTGEKPLKIQDSCIKIYTDWIGNIKLNK